MQSQTERRSETPDPGDAIGYIRFGMDLATRSDLQEVRGEVQEVRGEVREVWAEVREGRGETQELRGELQEVRGEVRELRSEVAALRAAIKTAAWILAALISAFGVAIAAIQLFG